MSRTLSWSPNQKTVWSDHHVSATFHRVIRTYYLFLVHPDWAKVVLDLKAGLTEHRECIPNYVWIRLQKNLETNFKTKTKKHSTLLINQKLFCKASSTPDNYLFIPISQYCLEWGEHYNFRFMVGKEEDESRQRDLIGFVQNNMTTLEVRVKYGKKKKPYCLDSGGSI